MLDSLRAVWRHHKGEGSICLLIFVIFILYRRITEHSTTRANLTDPTYLPQEVTATLAAAGKLDAVMFTPSGPAGVFAVYVTPGANLGRVFLNEFVCVRTPLRPIPATSHIAYLACRPNRTSSLGS